MSDWTAEKLPKWVPFVAIPLWCIFSVLLFIAIRVAFL